MKTHTSTLVRGASRRTLALFLAFTAMILAISISGASTAEAKPRPVGPTAALATAAAPASGTLADGTGDVAGTFQIKKFVAKHGQMMAKGTFTGTVTDASGTTSEVTKAVALPVVSAAAAGSCEILNLVLGPLDLDLLGLVVHLDKVVLNITAQAGAGNLLGNLLCAVAGLLDGGLNLQALLAQIAALLNQLLGLLG